MLDSRKHHGRRLAVSLLVCVLIIGAGVIVVMVSVGAWNPSHQAEAANVATETRIPNVKVQTLQAVTVDDLLELTGALEPWEQVVVSSETSGKIEWKGVEEGQRVKSGQDIFKIDTKTVLAQLAQANAEHKLASQDFERIERLTKTGASAAQNLDAVVARRDVAAANRQLLEIQVAKSVVRTPFDGIADQVFKEGGEFVDVGTPLARLVQVHKVKVTVGIPERDIAFFQEGNPVTVRLDALPGQSFSGTIHKIATTADPATHTFRTEVELDNADGALRPGMIARAGLVRQSHPDSLLIPIFASVLLDDERYVFVEEEGIAHLRSIEVGVTQGGSVQVTSGLKPGDHLIVAGQYDVRDGERVKIQEEIP